MKRAIAGVAFVAAAALTASACGSNGSRSAQVATTTSASAAALRGQTVTLLTHDSFAASPAVLQAFTASTGIHVRVLKQGDAGALVNRAILTRDNPQGDALFGVDNTFLSRAIAHDLFEAHTYAGAARLDSRVRALFRGTETRAVPVDFGDVCVNYDKGWFAKHKLAAPRTLEDLTAPRYRNLSAVESPATSSTGLVFLLATIARYGDAGWRDYWKRLKRNGVLPVEGWEQAYNGEFSAGSGHGTRPIVVSYASSPPADVVFSDPKKSTSSVGVMFDGCFRQYEFAGVLRGAAHPQAAQRLVEFMLSRKFQEDMPLQMFVYPARADATLPVVFVRLGPLAPHPLQLSPDAIDRHRDEWIAAWTDAVL
jgi:thiamine transport system substrate-binding protein